MGAVALYRFHWDCGRHGELEGIFLADPKDIPKIIGQVLEFGEVLGKHSDIRGLLEEGEIELVSADPGVIQVVHTYGLTNGFNPFDYWKCSECGGTMNPSTERCYSRCGEVNK